MAIEAFMARQANNLRVGERKNILIVQVDVITPAFTYPSQGCFIKAKGANHIFRPHIKAEVLCQYPVQEISQPVSVIINLPLSYTSLTCQWLMDVTSNGRYKPEVTKFTHYSYVAAKASSILDP